MESGSTRYIGAFLILGSLVGVGQITLGHGKVKKIGKGVVLRSRERIKFKDSDNAVMLELSCTCDAGWL